MTQFGVWLPLFDELADPAVVTSLAVTAEEHGWDGLFVWDHMAWRAPIQAIGDPWIALAAAGAVTERLTLGPMVTPLARRRPTKVARETAALDRLTGGRFVLGVGLGSDRFAGEYSRTGDAAEDRVRAAQLDESLDILRRAWTGEPVRHRGEHYVVDDIAFAPTPVHGHIPVWVAALPGSRRPLRRAAAHDGFFPVNLTSPDQLAESIAIVQSYRAAPETPFEIAAAVQPDVDPSRYAAAGATWILTDLDPENLQVSDIQSLVREGPARSA